MSDLICKNYLFSSEEFMVLSAGAGIKKLPVLFEDEPKQPEKEELEQTIFQLYQKEILTWESDGSYTVRQDVRTLLQDMKAAKKELHIYSKKTGGPLLCFWDEYVVVTELSGNDNGAVRVHSLPKNEFLDELRDRGILPERDCMQFAEVIDKDSEEQCICFLQESPAMLEDGHMQYELLEELLEKNRDLFAFIALYDRVLGQNQGVALILNCGLADCITYVGDGQTHICYYTERDLRELFQL